MQSSHFPGSQQYKDSVIWRVALRAAEHSDVYLVTNDGAFFAGRTAVSSLTLSRRK